MNARHFIPAAVVAVLCSAAAAANVAGLISDLMVERLVPAAVVVMLAAGVATCVFVVADGSSTRRSTPAAMTVNAAGFGLWAFASTQAAEPLIAAAVVAGLVVVAAAGLFASNRLTSRRSL